MNTLPMWDAEPRASAPVPHVDPPGPTDEPALEVDPRRAALARVLGSLDSTTGRSEAITLILEAIDAADAESGVARVDTNNAILQHRIARIVSGAAMPSRGPATRAREILGLIHDAGAA